MGADQLAEGFPADDDGAGLLLCLAGHGPVCGDEPSAGDERA